MTSPSSRAQGPEVDGAAHAPPGPQARSARGARFTALFRSMHPELLAYAHRHGHRSTAHDVVDEAFLVVWRRWDDVPHDASAQRAWVYGIVKRTMVHHVEARRRSVRLDVKLLGCAEAVLVAEDPAEVVAGQASVGHLLSVLTAPERAVVELVALVGMTAAQAADVLGCSVTAVTTRLSRARAKIRASSGGERASGDDGGRR